MAETEKDRFKKEESAGFHVPRHAPVACFPERLKHGRHQSV